MSDSAPSPLLFLSHSGSDTDAARSLKRRIEEAPAARERGLKVWCDKDDLRAGEPWQSQLEEAIERRATAFAVYVGDRGVINWVEAEVRLGLSRAVAGNGSRFPFIPILAPGAKSSSSLPGFARQFQGVRDVETSPDEFQKLIAAVLGDGDAGLRELEKDPFFGLKAIDETRNHLFFGRERETRELIERLSDTPLLMVIGDSGSGKSSLVRAGVVPRWRGGAMAELRGNRPEEEIWHVIETRPGRFPLRALGDAVFATARRLGESAENWGTYKDWIMNGDVERVRDGLRCGMDAGRARTLIVVDQFEELLILTPEEHRRPFVDLLLALSEPADDAFAVVLTMRRDYYNRCSDFPPLHARLEADGRRARYLLGRMENDDLRRAITEPLNLAGVNEGARRALARNVLQDVGERPGDLALVQFALTMAWQHRNEYEGDLLRSYSELGRVEGALAKAAERVYADLLRKGASEFEIEAVFLRLVRGGDAGRATRRVARCREFRDPQWMMLQALADEKGNRLVQISGPENDERVEIAHEALVTQWKRFQDWLQAAGSDKRNFDRLIEKAVEWDANDRSAVQPDKPGHGKDQYLATGPELQSPVHFRRWLQATAGWLIELMPNDGPAGHPDDPGRGKDQYLATGAELQSFCDLASRRRAWLSRNEIAYVDAGDRARRQNRAWDIFQSWARDIPSILAVIATAAALLLLARAWQETQTAAANEIHAIAASSRVALAEGRPDEAALLALAAWSRSDGDQHLRLETTLQNLSKAISTGLLRQWRHVGMTGAMATKDGTRILSWSGHGALRLWDAATGQQIAHMGPDGGLVGAVMTDDGKHILSWSDEAAKPPAAPGLFSGTLRLWDATGRQIGPAMRRDDRVSIRGAVLTKDGTRILSWYEDGALRLSDATNSNQAVAAMKAMKHEGEVGGALLMNGETRILSWSDDGTLRLWEASTGERTGPAMRHEDRVRGVALTKDETRILSWSLDHTLKLWNAERNAEAGRQIGASMKHDGFVRGATLTKDGSRILSWSDDGMLRLWDARTGHQFAVMKHGGPVNGALLTMDETRILSWCTADGTLRLWDAATGRQLDLSMFHPGVQGAVLTKDEAQILSWSKDGTIRLWDAAMGRQIAPAMAHGDWIRGAVGAVLTNDETRILSWSDDHTLRLWNVATGVQIGSDMRHDKPVRGAVLTNDGARILSWSDDDTLSFWDAATHQQIGPAMKHDGRVVGAMLMEDGTQVLSWSDDDTLRLWDAAAHQQIGPAMKHNGRVVGAILMKDGKQVLSWSDDGTLRLWGAATGRQTGPAMRHGKPVRGAVLTKDGARILSWSDDDTLRLWDAATHQQIGPAMKHDGRVAGAMLMKDGTQVLSWSNDGTVRRWNVSWPKGNLLEIACATFGKLDASPAAERYGLMIRDPVCAPVTATLVPDWSSIQPATDPSDR